MGFIKEEEFIALLESFKKVEGRDWSVLFGIFEKCVKPMVYNWYIMLDDHLKNPSREAEDFFLDVTMETLYKVEGSLKSHEGQKISARAAQLHGWLETVTRNALNDEKKRLIKEYEYNELLKKIYNEGVPCFNSEEADETYRTLRESFRVVINSRKDIHKILYWLNLAIFTLATVNSRAMVKKHITPILSDMTLAQMYETVQIASKKIGWMRLTQDDMDKIEEALAQPYKDSITLGMAILSDFYGNRSATAATSDWVNKIDKMIERSMGDGSFRI